MSSWPLRVSDRALDSSSGCRVAIGTVLPFRFGCFTADLAAQLLWAVSCDRGGHVSNRLGDSCPRRGEVFPGIGGDIVRGEMGTDRGGEPNV